ncbi:RES family NAD+ phosphorylase [Sphingomonas arantia]|uniref:RES family NAD+ phosphorylase n=1 Tax=Sphingomonas arantia TaxID=1460676 RepID=A0ABW4TTD3_9SPHN
MSFAISSVKDRILYRATSLKYYSTGLASIGARKSAGRFNRHGQSAMYLSFEPETALKEYWNGTIRPVVTIPVNFSSERLVDLRGGVSGMDSHWIDWVCAWKDARELFDNGDKTADCSSWKCFDDVIKRNMNGIIYPSQQNSTGTNLVLFPEHAILNTWIYTPVDPGSEIADANPVDLS